MKGFIHSVQPSSLSQEPQRPSMGSAGETQQAFAQSLKDAIQRVNDTQQISDRKTEALSKGEITNLHDVMITAQKASITLETTVQIQRKVIDAYNEVMRMQV